MLRVERYSRRDILILLCRWILMRRFCCPSGGLGEVGGGGVAHNLSPYSTENCVCVSHQMQMKFTQTTCNLHGQREDFAFGTQCNLYSTDSR